MITFKSFVNSEKTWKLCLKSQKEMTDIYYQDTEPETGVSTFGITEYPTTTVYIDKGLDGFLLMKTLRHELMHIYLWEIGKNASYYWEDEICDIISEIAPLICETAEKLALQIKK